MTASEIIVAAQIIHAAVNGAISGVLALSLYRIAPRIGYWAAVVAGITAGAATALVPVWGSP